MKKAKRKTPQAGASGKAPGAPRAKNTPPLEAWKIKAVHSVYPPPQHEDHEDGGLTYAQARFVQAYIDNNGNARAAYMIAFPHVTWGSAAVMGHYLLQKESIQSALEAEREEMRQALGVTREKLLRVQVAMAFSTIDQLTNVFRAPGAKDSYREIGMARYAIKSVKQGEFGNELTMVDRQAALNELWTKLGFKEGSDSKDSGTDKTRVYADVIDILNRRKS